MKIGFFVGKNMGYVIILVEHSQEGLVWKLNSNLLRIPDFFQGGQTIGISFE
jgi:hypothetical protein